MIKSQLKLNLKILLMIRRSFVIKTLPLKIGYIILLYLYKKHLINNLIYIYIYNILKIHKLYIIYFEILKIW